MKINLMIRGLAGFLPQPFDAPERVRILIPDVRSELEREGMTVCRHFPKLILPDETWDLDGEHIEITGGVGAPEITQEFRDKMSDMKMIAPGSETVAPSYLGDPPVPPSPDRVSLIAALSLTSGTFSITAEALKRMAFRAAPDAPSVLEGEFAEFVQIHIEVPGGAATLRTKRFADGAETHRKDFAGGPADIVDVIVKNLCDEEEGQNRPDQDFVIYYDFSHDFRGARVIPYPLPPVPPLLVAPEAPAKGVDGTAFRLGGCIAGMFRR